MLYACDIRKEQAERRQRPGDPYGILSSDIGSLFSQTVKARQWDSVASLLQIHASRTGWCSVEDCGACPFASGLCCDEGRTVLAQDFVTRHYPALLSES